MLIDPMEFRHTVGNFATGVAVATTHTGQNKPLGLTVNSFTSVSLDPPLVLFCLDKKAGCAPIYEKATHYALNFLSDEQQSISNLFAHKSDHPWDDVDWAWSEENQLPLLKGAIAHIECAVERQIDAGDHIIYLGRVLKLDRPSQGNPLLYFRGSYQNLAD